METVIQCRIGVHFQLHSVKFTGCPNDRRTDCSTNKTPGQHFLNLFGNLTPFLFRGLSFSFERNVVSNHFLITHDIRTQTFQSRPISISFSFSFKSKVSNPNGGECYAQNSPNIQAVRSFRFSSSVHCVSCLTFDIEPFCHGLNRSIKIW